MVHPLQPCFHPRNEMVLSNYTYKSSFRLQIHHLMVDLSGDVDSRLGSTSVCLYSSSISRQDVAPAAV